MGIAYTLIGSAVNWSNPASWSPAGVPGNGDTATIGSGWVVVDANITIGASNGQYVAGSNPAAIYITSNGGLSFNNPNFKLVVRGDIICDGATTSRGITAGAGCTLEFDSSATSPTSTSYRFVALGNGVSSIRIISALANLPTQANPFTVQSNAGGANAYFESNGFTYFGSLGIQYTKFLRMGTAAKPMWSVGFNGTTYTVNVSNCTFDTCGPINVITANGAANQCNFTDCVWTRSLQTYNTQLLPLANYTRCVFDKLLGSNVNQDSATFTNCFFGGDISNGGQANQQGDFTNNLVVVGSGDRQITGTNVKNSLFIVDGINANPHGLLNGTHPQIFDGLVFEFTNISQAGSGVIFETPAGTAGNTYEVKNCLCLPSAAGQNSCDLSSMQGSFNNGGTVSIHNNTATVMGKCITCDETGDNAPGTYTLIAKNIAWTRSGYVASDSFFTDIGHLNSGPAPVDVVSPANVKTNNLFGSYLNTRPANTWYTNQGNGYTAAFSLTPGATDLHADPQFKDSTRNLATFDSAYLKHVAGSTWASHASTDTFSVGDIVSNNNPSFYFGSVVNFRCIQSHVKSTANSEPGGSFVNDWRPYWELASYNTIRTNLTGGVNGSANTITDASLGLSGADYVTAYLAWVRDGFAPTNQTLKTAGYDGSYIGAVPVQTLSGFQLPFPDFMALSTFTPSAFAVTPVSLASSNIALPGSGTAAVVVTNLGDSPVWVALGTSNAVTVSVGLGVPVMPGSSFPLSQGANTYIAFCSSGSAGSYLSIATGS